MNLQHLKYAVEVQRTGSISQAAENLFMGQPNLSKAIKELESQVGVVLFERTTKGAVPTAKGELFLRHARSIIAQLDEITLLCQEDEPVIQTFSVCVPRASYIAAAFADFVDLLDHTERFELIFRETGAAETIRSVAENGARIGVLRYQAAHEPLVLGHLADRGLEHRLLMEYDDLILMSRAHPLAEKETLSARELASGVEIAHGDDEAPYLPADELRRQRRLGDRRRIFAQERGSQYELLAKVRSSYLWSAPVTEEVLERHGLVLRPCSDAGRRRRDAVIRQKGYVPDALEASFLRELERVSARIAPD